MDISYIGYDNKRRGDLWTSGNANEIKEVVNGNADILSALEQLVSNLVSYTPDGIKKILFEDDGIYQVKDGTVYPVSHPDMSTQPSILPQRYGNLPVREVIVPLTRSDYVYIGFGIVPTDAMVMECSVFSDVGMMPASVKKASTGWLLKGFNSGDMPTSDKWQALVRYVVMDEGSSYGSGEGRP